ncbi:MAG: tRNA lysidine(34) synthetase TilS, partial [Bdellovibrionota bacterium]
SHSASLDRDRNSGIEAAARRLRYDFFRQLARENRVSKVATAHTLDDQAETVLLRVLRGAGIRGLAGIHPRLILRGLKSEEQGPAFVEVIRPLLHFRRAELQQFLSERGQKWREDSSNLDLGFLRNRMRHRVLPVLRENFGDASVENLADLAEIARAEEEHWRCAHPEIHALADSLDTAFLLSLPLAAQRRLVRNWLEERAPAAGVSFRWIEGVLDLARSAAGKTFDLPAGHRVRRTRDRLCLEPPGAHQKAGYEYLLPIPGEVELSELGIRLQALLVDPKSVPETGQDSLLDPTRLPSTLTVRNWRPGDRFCPAHTKETRKVKELLSDRHVTGAEKKLWPVIAARDDLVWMRGFPVPAAFQSSPGAPEAVWIRESPKP